MYAVKAKIVLVQKVMACIILIVVGSAQVAQLSRLLSGQNCYILEVQLSFSIPCAFQPFINTHIHIPLPAASCISLVY